MMLPKIVLDDFSSWRTLNEHNRSLLVPETKARRCALAFPSMLKLGRKFMREVINWKNNENVLE